MYSEQGYLNINKHEINVHVNKRISLQIIIIRIYLEIVHFTLDFGQTSNHLK